MISNAELLQYYITPFYKYSISCYLTLSYPKYKSYSMKILWYQNEVKMYWFETFIWVYHDLLKIAQLNFMKTILRDLNHSEFVFIINSFSWNQKISKECYWIIKTTLHIDRKYMYICYQCKLIRMHQNVVYQDKEGS